VERCGNRLEYNSTHVKTRPKVAAGCLFGGPTLRRAVPLRIAASMADFPMSPPLLGKLNFGAGCLALFAGGGGGGGCAPLDFPLPAPLPAAGAAGAAGVANAAGAAAAAAATGFGGEGVCGTEAIGRGVGRS